MSGFQSNRIAVLNASDNTVKTSIQSVTFEVFSVLWDVYLGHIVLPSNMDMNYVEVSQSPKLGKDKVKISAPMEYWQFAIKVQSLVKVANQRYANNHTGIIPKYDGKKLVIAAK